jgi:anti-sigma regulatory factor (Ser/Thr protein kinase)
MPTVEITFSPLPAHVRTARLMAVAIARRTHVDESLLDELRLAVGEACSRAVRLHLRFAPEEPVAMFLTDEDGSLAIDVVDAGPYDAAPAAEDDPAALVDALVPAAPPTTAADDFSEGLPSGVVLAVISGLVDTVTISPEPDRGTRVHMQWPAGRTASDTQTLDVRDLHSDLPV